MQKKPDLPDDFWQSLVDTERFGILLTIDEVKSWFDSIWPKYSSKYYKRHQRAIASWWSRAWESDIIEAQCRLKRIEDRKTVERMEARLPSREIGEIPDFFSEVDRT